MMSHLGSLDVRLWLDGERLRYSAPAGVLTPALRAELSERKHEISTFLRTAQRALVDANAAVLPLTRKDNLPLSFAQQRLWFLHCLEPESPAYNMPAALRLTGDLNLLALHQSLNEIVRRHEVLRTTFASVDGRPVQTVMETSGLRLRVIDLQMVEPNKREQQVLRWARAEADRPFDLTRPP